MLAIGDGKHGFTLSDIDTSLMASKVLAMAKASMVSDEEEASIRAHKASRDEPFSELKEVKELPFPPKKSKKQMADIDIEKFQKEVKQFIKKTRYRRLSIKK